MTDASFVTFVAENQPIIQLIETMLLDPQLKSRVISSTDVYKKSASEASRLRGLGNVSYRSNLTREALNYYNRSVAAAPADSEELALGFGNRSAALYTLGKYELCLLDINRALKGHIPERAKSKLLNRKTKCWALLEAENELKSSILEGREFVVPNEPLDVSERRFYHIKKMSIDESDFINDCDDYVWNTKFDNPLLPKFSSKVKLISNACKTQWGYYLVAEKDIAPGEILAIEDLFAVRTLEEVDELHSFCAHCTAWCEALIPCSMCTLQMYCSERCRQEAYDTYHRVECKMLPLFSLDENEDLEQLLLGLRMFLVGTRQGSELASLMNDPNVYDSLLGKQNFVGSSSANEYLAILNIPWENGSRPNSAKKETIACLSFVRDLFDGLRRVNFFGNGQNAANKKCVATLTDVELFSGLILFHHLSIIQRQFNLHAQFVGDKRASKEKSIDIGTSISAFQTLMNHSCDPNTYPITDKRRNLFFSARFIKTGERIEMPYGGFIYSRNTRGRRRECLRALFNVKCRCKACVENWPLVQIMARRKNTYLTSNEKIIEEIEGMHEHLLNLMKVPLVPINEFQDALVRKVFEFLENMRHYTKQPSSTMLLCDEFVRNCMQKKGNCYSSLSTAALIKYSKVSNV